MHILAYIDPGSGALIWQSIIGVFVGMFFYLRKTRKWIGRLMGRVFGIGQRRPKPAVRRSRWTRKKWRLTARNGPTRAIVSRPDGMLLCF